MSEPNILHFNPVIKPDNNPQAAASARARIATLPDSYAHEEAPPKEKILKDHLPVSPLAQDHSLRDELPKLRELTPALGSLGARNIKQKISKAKQPGKLHPILIGILTFAVLFAIFKAPIITSQLSYLTDKPPAAAPAPAAPAAQTVGAEPIISIPKINVNAPVVYPTTTANSPNYDPELENGVVHYPGTALPGEVGNSVLFGHSSNDWWEPGNYKFVFVLLDKLVVGDTYTVNYNGKQYLYQVTSTQIVEPTEVGILKATPDAQMTLITCTPPGTAWKRFIVHAKLLNPVVETSKTPASSSNKAGGVLPSNAPDAASGIEKIWSSFIGIFTGQKPTQTTPEGALPSPK